MAERSEIGKMKDGRVVTRYTVANKNGTSASFTDLGAIWLTMSVRDRNGDFRDVVLGCDTLDALLINPGHMGEPVGRNANRIANGRFGLNGKEYVLQQNKPPHSLHSGPDFYSLRIWDASCGEDYVLFSLESPDGDQGYPGNAHIEVKYTLTEDDTLCIEYSVNADQDTVFNMTNHAYFNLNGHDSGDILSHLVTINADKWTPADALSVPTGEISGVEGTPMDFRSEKAVGEEIEADFAPLKEAGGYDHNYCLNGFDPAKRQMRPAASFYSPESGIFMEVSTDLEGMQFYTANGMKDKVTAKDGAHYGPRTGCCFETQHYPDAVNHPEFPSPFIQAGETVRTCTSFRFTVRS